MTNARPYLMLVRLLVITFLKNTYLLSMRVSILLVLSHIVKACAETLHGVAEKR